jgi:hypothetical protein
MAGEIGDILDRLQLCNDDIASLNSFRLPPPIVESDYPPFIYSIPPTLSEVVHTGRVLRTTTVAMECLVRPFGEKNLTTAAETSQGVEDMATYLELIVDYYNTHRKLRTNTLPDLEFVAKDIVIQASPQFPMTGHDGNPYFGLVINLTIEYLVRS